MNPQLACSHYVQRGILKELDLTFVCINMSYEECQPPLLLIVLYLLLFAQYKYMNVHKSL